jgi:hypothetical protein
MDNKRILLIAGGLAIVGVSLYLLLKDKKEQVDESKVTADAKKTKITFVRE